MKHPFCYPSPRHWETKKDETVTVSQFFETLDWDGTRVSVVGSQANDYNGASHLFEVKVDRDLVIKFFGGCRLYSASLYPHDGIMSDDRDHLMSWAKENGINSVDELKARFHEYKNRFSSHYPWGPDGYIRISVY